MGRKPSKAEKARQRKQQASQSSTAAGGTQRGRGRGRGRGQLGRSSLLAPDRQAAFESRRRTVQLEESAFAKLSPPVLEKLNLLAAYAPLQRPILPTTAQFGWHRFGKARADHQRKLQQQQQLDDHAATHEMQAQHHLSDWLASSLPPGDNTDDPSGSSTPVSNVQHGIEQPHELRLPKRPRWRSDMDTKTLHSNEEEVFRNWLRQTDDVVEHAFFTSSPLFRDLYDRSGSGGDAMGGSRMTSASFVSVDEIKAQQPEPDTAIIGSLYERNIEVFRQLWRVCERSDLVCVLADARCPPLHLPPSLTAFLERYMRLKVVIVLTKADIVPPPIVEGWKTWLSTRFPNWEVVITESYAKRERMEGQGARARFTPYLSPSSRSALFAALKRAHRDLVTPPPGVREDEERRKRWIPPCTTFVDWEGIEKRVAAFSDHGVGEGEGGEATVAAEAQQDDDHDDEDDDRDDEDDQHPPPRDAGGTTPPSKPHNTTDNPPPAPPPPFLTIGLIGQPNVGKSSLLNALFGSKVVRASKTPGKTKHFQTHFLSPLFSSSSSITAEGGGEGGGGRKGRKGEVRLCDSPGLVFPSLVGMEMQVMGAILPISQVQALSSVVRFVGQQMPLERVLGFSVPPPPPPPTPSPSPTSSEEGVATPQKEEGKGKEEREEWTSTKLLEKVAERYGWRTAKANRWDVNRAGNAVMRAVVEGRVRWAFRPPAFSPTFATAPATAPARTEDSISRSEEEEEEESSRILTAALEKGDGVWLDGLARSVFHDSAGEGSSSHSHSLEAAGGGRGEDILLTEHHPDIDVEEEDGNAMRGREKKVHFDDSSPSDDDASDDEEEEEEEEEEGEEGQDPTPTSTSRFAALAIEDAAASESESESEESNSAADSDSDEEEEGEDEEEDEDENEIGD